MGRRGPAPQPTVITKLKGNPGKRPLNKHEPKPEIVLPHCPEFLDKDARKEWNRLAPILLRMKVLTEADYIALASLCQAYSTMVKAQVQLNKTGILECTPKVRHSQVRHFPSEGRTANEELDSLHAGVQRSSARAIKRLH